MLTKDGSTGGHWQERYVVAYNKADNYCVKYFKGDSAAGQEKGKINTVAFYARHFDNEDKAKFECEHGVTLCPWSSNDRYYHFKCKDKNDADEWYSTLRTCCRYAEPPLDDNIVIAEAFKNALSITRQENGVYGSSSCYYDECESLANFIFELVDRAVLQDAFNKLPEMGRDSTIAIVKSSVMTSIKTACKAAWAPLRAGCDSVTNDLKKAVSPAIQPLIDAEVDLIQKVSDMVETTAGSSLKGLGDKFLPDPARLLKNYATASVTEAAKAFSTFCKSIIPELKGADKAKAIKLLEKMERQTWYHWSGCLRECYTQADKVYDALAGSAVFEGGMDRYDVYWIVRDGAVGLYRNAVNTFFNKYFAALEAGNTDINVDHICTEVSIMAAHDAPIVVEEIFYATFVGMIEQNEGWRSGVLEPMSKAVEPVQAVIDKIPVVKEFINLQNILDKTLSASLRALVKPTIDETCAGAIDAASLVGAM